MKTPFDQRFTPDQLSAHYVATIVEDNLRSYTNPIAIEDMVNQLRTDTKGITRQQGLNYSVRVRID